METLLISLLLLIVVLLTLYFLGTSTYNHWKKLGVPHKVPKWPFSGTPELSIFNKEPIVIRFNKTYNQFKDERFYGAWLLQNPILILRDPELIATVFVKEFSNFTNTGLTTLTKESDFLSHLKDERWKNLREKISPIFSPVNIKGMFQQIMDCSDQLMEHCDQLSENGLPMDACGIFSKFDMDVTIACSFGLSSNSIKNTNTLENKFIKSILATSFSQGMRIQFKSCLPLLITYLKWPKLDKEMNNFITDTVKVAVQHRLKNNVVRKDILQVMMDIKGLDKPKLKESYVPGTEDTILKDQLMMVNIYRFLIGGLGTTSTTLSYCLYELARHQDIQEKARQHVMDILEEHNGQITYESINEMAYLKNIVEETLRIYPILFGTQRTNKYPFQIPGTNIVLPGGTVIYIPNYSIHHDPKYYPDPEKFIPERFSKENRCKIKRGMYLPFNDGPRVCIGERFLKLEIHLMLARLLIKYKFTLNDKTKTQLTYDPKSLFLLPFGGIWIDVHKRV